MMSREQLQRSVAEAARSAGVPAINSAHGSPMSTFAEIITEAIEPNYLTLDVVSSFMPTRVLNFGDSLVKKVRGRFPVRTFVPGTNHLADQIATKEVLVHSVDAIVAKFRYNLLELRRGEIGTVDQLRNDLGAALGAEFVRRVYALTGTVWSAYNGGSNYTAVSDLNTTTLDAMIETVLRRSPSIRGIFTVRRRLTPLYQTIGLVEHQYNSSNFVLPVDKYLQEYWDTNRISSYKGIPIVELPQIYGNGVDDYDTPLIPEDLCLVIGDAAGEVILYGPTETQEHIDTEIEPADYSLALWRYFGMIIDHPERIGVIKFTSA